MWATGKWSADAYHGKDDLHLAPPHRTPELTPLRRPRIICRNEGAYGSRPSPEQPLERRVDETSEHIRLVVPCIQLFDLACLARHDGVRIHGEGDEAHQITVILSHETS